MKLLPLFLLTLLATPVMMAEELTMMLDWIANPAKAFDSLTSSSADLKDDLNAKVWVDTVAHFATDPTALDAARYEDFGLYM